MYCSKKDRNNETEIEANAKRFYGPPTSCDDLNKLGYTLNGYYLIKAKEKLDASRIQVTYCRFHQPTGVKQGNKCLFLDFKN